MVVEKSKQRNTTLSLCKGIAIILMVVGHAEAPELVTNFIYTFHMPLFFIAAGYFFSDKALSDPWTFCKKRFSKLYIPFLKWSLIYLALHNVWHHFGILNETYGNWENGVTHPYSWSDGVDRFLKIIFSMSGYDEFMAGAFWFFRGLLLASIGYLIIHKLLSSKTRLTGWQISVGVMVLVIAFNAFRFANNTKIPLIPNGGLRETWGIFFFAVGVLFRKYEYLFMRRWWLLILSFLLILTAGYLHTCGMNNSGKFLDLLTLPITGCVGFLMIYWISGYIDRKESTIKRLLCFIGDNTLYILIWHIPAYKLVSLAKIHYYDLDPLQIGCHMVIHYNNTDFFWPIYSIVGVTVPLLIIVAYRKLKGTYFSRPQPVLSEN